MLPKDPFAVDVLSAELMYQSLGWSIIPIVRPTTPDDEKTPTLKRWKPFQTKRADEQQIRDWFDKRDDLGLAVVLGAVSGGLTCRDYDVESAYHAWKAQNPDLATTLPTAKTGRGYHVFFRSDLDHTEKCLDGELRGERSYVVLPPSPHLSGVKYRWIIPPSSNIPRLDDRLFQGREPTERQKPMASGSPSLRSSVSPGLCLSVGSGSWDAVIDRCLPTSERQRNHKLMDLARWVKADPKMRDADPSAAEHIVREWHKRALPAIRTKPFSETQADFEHAWESVKFPVGVDIVQEVWRKVKSGTWPTEAERYDSPDMRWLLALCLGLQRHHGNDRRFFLSCRSAAEVLGRDHTDIAKWLKKFVRDGLLRAFPQEDRRLAHRYQYLGPSGKEHSS